MIKHMLTTACNRKCAYCISRNVHTKMNASLDATRHVYAKLAKKDLRGIMFTGGEPTLRKDWWVLATLASQYWSDNVHLTTSDPDVLDWSDARATFRSISLSIHDPEILEAIRLSHYGFHPEYYAYIMANQYSDELAMRILDVGFDGLTVSEDQRGTEVFDETRIPRLNALTGGSVRVNRRTHCMDETIILPDLSIVTDFRPYL